METLGTSLLEWGGETKLLSGYDRNKFRKILYHFGGIILFQPTLQVFAYLSFLVSSALIILRM